MSIRLLFFFSLLSFYGFTQSVKTTKPDSTFDDYWETELSPITDMQEIISYVFNDPFNYMFIKYIPGGNPLEREISVNSFYGTRKHPIHGVFKFHRGIDLQGTQGEPVIASGDGEVIATGFMADLGNFIKVKHRYGFESIYGHLSKVYVKKGQKVLKGKRIGLVGATGKVTGPHLHYTLKKNLTYLDPFDFLYMNFKASE